MLLHAFHWFYLNAEIYLLLLIVTEKYEPVHAKWTTERCAVCRWVEDWDDNNMIICNRCFSYCLWSLPFSCRAILDDLHFISNLLGFKGSDVNYICFLVLLCRCQIAVHQECYGVRGVQDFTSWVCRVCETPDVERECCLCPVKGMSI
jgi:hypothetical protein